MKAFNRNQFYALGEDHKLLIEPNDVTDIEQNSGIDAAKLAVELIEELSPRPVNRDTPPRYTGFDLGLIFELGRIQGIREAGIALSDE